MRPRHLVVLPAPTSTRPSLETETTVATQVAPATAQVEQTAPLTTTPQAPLSTADTSAPTVYQTTPPPTAEEEMFQRLEARMTARHQALEGQLLNYSQSLQAMQHQMVTLQQQLLEMTKMQFQKLAAVITNTLQLPEQQALLLQDIVDDHLRQLAVAAQLQPPRGPFRTAAPQYLHTDLQGISTSPSTQPHNRDPRLVRAVAMRKD